LEGPGEIVSSCVAEAAHGDVIVVMSSGHFEGLPERIYRALKERR
jgi:UDP-N-acetylmuramate-alanine ligase